MQPARVIPDAVNEVSLPPDAHLSLLAGNGKDVLFFVWRRQKPASIVLNQWIGGAWGQEVTLDASEGDPSRTRLVSFWQTASGMSVVHEATKIAFDRFGPDLADQVRFMRLGNGASLARNRLTPLKGTIDEVFSMIENQVLYQRVEALEKEVAELKGSR